MNQTYYASEGADEALQRILNPDNACVVKEGAICLSMGEGCSDYEISFQRCDTYAKIISWVNHLSRTNWVTMDQIHRFIEAACAKHNLDPDASKN